MAELRIEHRHALGLAQARELAQQWAAQGERDWGLQRMPSQDADTVHFARTGVQGCLQVQADRFVLQLQLGFLLSAYAPRIEQQIRQNLLEWLGPEPSPQA